MGVETILPLTIGDLKMTIFDFKIGDKVVRSGKLHKNETLLELFRIAKEKYNQDYLYKNLLNSLVTNRK